MHDVAALKIMRKKRICCDSISVDDACDQLSRFQWLAHILVSYSNIFRYQACFPALLAPKFYGGFSGWPTWDCQKPLSFLWLNGLVSGGLYIQYMYVYIYCIWHLCLGVCECVYRRFCFSIFMFFSFFQHCRSVAITSSERQTEFYLCMVIDPKVANCPDEKLPYGHDYTL